MTALKTKSQTQVSDWPSPTPIEWRCPQCGSTHLTPDFLPRCSRCGFMESGT